MNHRPHETFGKNVNQMVNEIQSTFMNHVDIKTQMLDMNHLIIEN